MIKDTDEISAHDVMESAQESVYLVFNVDVHLVECELFYVLPNVIVGHLNVCTALFQRQLLVPTEVVASHQEVLANSIDVVIKGPLQILEAVIVHILQILKGEIFSNHHLVEGTGEVTLQQLSIKDGLTYHTPDELEKV